MKRFFLSVLAVTFGTLTFLAVAAAVWVYYESKAPELTAELLGFSTVEAEGKEFLVLDFVVENRDSEDYDAGTWQALPIDDYGAIVGLNMVSEAELATKLYAKERSRIRLRTVLEVEGEMFAPTTDIEQTGSRRDAEHYLNNLHVFRKTMGYIDQFLLMNEAIPFRQRISIAPYYESELARREAILAKHGEPVDDPVFRAELEATPFCEKGGDTYPCRYQNVIIGEPTPAPEDFSPQEHKRRLASLPECSEIEGQYPCKIGEFILEGTEEEATN